MSGQNIGDILKAAGSREIDVSKNEVAIFKHFVQERKHPLDLVRELIANSGAREVGATRIEISYTKDREGHIFEVNDNGCGMNFTGDQTIPGRLDRFLGLGMSGIVGQKADEFAWKGLGAKLAYQSKRIEIETRFTGHPLYEVRVNEPWDTINRNLIPKPRITEHNEPDAPSHTTIRVVGHPPHRQEQPFSMEEIRQFLLHRTFVGFTSPRESPPEIVLSVLGNVETLPFGFPEFRKVQWQDGIWPSEDGRTLFVNICPASSKKMGVRLKGFLTWNPETYSLSHDSLNTGLILSSKGIPYFNIDLEELGARGITHANPGTEKTCLVTECDDIHTEMNISRSDLVDSEKTVEFKKILGELLSELERSSEYLQFRQAPKRAKKVAAADALADEKQRIEQDDQTWVVLKRPGQQPLVLMREPANETEATAIFWKLEALGALPFAQFQTLAYPGATSGPDIFAHFREDQSSEPVRCVVFEMERNFYNYRAHGHHSSQYPRIICWDAPTSGRKVRLNGTNKEYTFTVVMDDYQVHVFVIRKMPNVDLMTRQQLRQQGVNI
jgi:hypothetical protein